MAECECGNPKKNGTVACENCQYLDGGGMVDTIIAAIRQLDTGDGVTLHELAENTGRPRDSVYNSLQRLKRSGRVTQRIAQDQEATSFGVRARYFLDDRRSHA